MKRSICFFAIVALAVLLAAAQARASVTLTPGNNPQPDEENVLLNKGDTGALVTGNTNQSNTPVEFTSSVNTLLIPSAGQAMIIGDPEDGGINQITITAPGFTFTDLIFNAANTADIGTPGALATVTAQVNESGGGTSTFTGSYNLGQGQGVGNGFATLVAANGETMSSVTITLPEGEFFHDLEQVRISGLTAVNGQVPEPATVIIWSLLALVGTAISLRRK
ncbi:MAG: hypothetical protein LLG00_11440 [Planctomycetaceae bacterium]|nr:hypothetical protein [Planctomycetaceae bacterium]